MKKNLILTAALGYNFKQVELFIKSLRKFYNDKVIFLIKEDDNELENKLRKYNCETIKVKTNKKEIQFKRYKIFLNYLKIKISIKFFYVIVGIYIFNQILLILIIRVKSIFF